MHPDLNKLQAQLDISFRNQQLIKEAFTHSSYVNEHRIGQHRNNERLEFLGDAVLELTVSEFLFKTYPQRPEGELTKFRASIVCEPSLVKFANELQFGSYVFLGKGEELTGGRTRPALLADVFEAFIGALFLDQGLEAIRRFLAEHVFSTMSFDGKLQLVDYKTKLQEYSQQYNRGSVEYRIAEESGPAHEREFVSEVLVNDLMLGRGIGRSKKESEQRAASQALLKLNISE